MSAPLPDVLREELAFAGFDFEETPDPELEDLILGCGDMFEALTLEHSQAGNSWVALGFYSDRMHGRGDTPKIAAARLFIAINT